METKLRKLILIGIVLYTLLILYFMFFAFHRVEHEYSEYGYEFMLLPEAVPLLFPDLSDLSFSWIYNLGNIAAFIPYGIFVPLLYPTQVWKFLSWFVMAIIVLETLQSLTFLGTFDVDDIISNTLGASIGWCVYKVSAFPKNFWKKLMASGLTVAVLLIGIMSLSELIDFTLQKREGPLHALNEMKEAADKRPLTKDLPEFTVGGEKIKPNLNMYGSKGNESQTYTYNWATKKEAHLYASYGIPDNGDTAGELIITADGRERVYYTESTQVVPVDIPFHQLNELTITLKGNAKLWDVTISEKKHWWE
ncbi:VanZ family protein [Paenibacillus chitinolyticus]|uniref:VanZ family protein n=1 Tax=Paenibacillus chitinolyticus TaxID=79263 RepID=UPI003D06D5AB